MIDVALLSVIRRWHYREGVPIRAIARRTGLSRNTVRKYLASEVCSGQLFLATELEVFQKNASFSFGDNPKLWLCGLTEL